MNSIDDSHDGEDAYGHDDDNQDDDDEVMIKSAQPRVLIFPGSASTLELSFSGFLPDLSENFTKCAFLRIPSWLYKVFYEMRRFTIPSTTLMGILQNVSTICPSQDSFLTPVRILQSV